MDHTLLPPAQAPRIHGAAIFGVRPGSPLGFSVSALSNSPLRFQAEGLPAGAYLDAASGQISGGLDIPGNYSFTVRAINSFGVAERNLTVCVGEEICLTPPMGWNSWYCYSESVSQQGILEAGRALVNSGLASYGWQYVNIDDCWQGSRVGPNMAIEPNERFPDMADLCQQIHSLSLKIGLYSTPWIGSYAGFVGGSAPNPWGDYSALALPLEDRLQPGQLFGRYPRFRECGADRVGEHWFFERDMEQWARWGIDFVKMDWHPNDVATTQRIANALRHAGRDIVLSLSNAAGFEEGPELAQLANLWRTTGDIVDSWESLSSIARAQERWQPLTRPGHFNDPDILQIGNLGKPNHWNNGFAPTRLTRHEQRFQFSLWCLLSAPLFLSCDLMSLNEWTVSLLTNVEVLAINQDPLGQPACYSDLGSVALWQKPLYDGSLAVGLFNFDDETCQVTIQWQQLGLLERSGLRDLWTGQFLDHTRAEDQFQIPGHGVLLLKVWRPNVDLSSAIRRREI